MRTRHLSTLMTMTLTATLHVAPLALAGDAGGEPTAEDERPEALSLRTFTSAGTGCRGGDASAELSADGASLSIAWSPFAAEAGRGVPQTEQRKNCQVAVSLEHSPGWQFAVESIAYGGDYRILAGAHAEVISAHYFQGESGDARVLNTLSTNSGTEAFNLVDAVAEEERRWSHCDTERALNVNFQARIVVESAGGAGFVRLAPMTDDAPSAVLRLVWRRCS